MNSLGASDDNPAKPCAINWTISTRCNYSCKYCFARFPELKGRQPLPFPTIKKIPGMLAEAGCEKLTFVGGEPTLFPHLPELLRKSHDVGLTTMLVTNGTYLSPNFLQDTRKHLDWISLSIDSQFEDVQQMMGRGAGTHVAQTTKNAEMIREGGIRLKLNSVITRYNFQEDMAGFIDSLSPERWKVFQFLSVQGQNQAFAEELAIAPEEFDLFVKRHRHLPYTVFEDNNAMRGSYLMLSPQGEFFSNISGRHEYTNSILEIGVEVALGQVYWDTVKFRNRGGMYEWQKPECVDSTQAQHLTSSFSH